MAWSLTEETFLVWIRVAAIFALMTFVPAPVAVVYLALWHDHYSDLSISVLTASGRMETCIAPLAPQGFELWWSNLPRSSHEKSARTFSARLLLLLTVRWPMVIATTEAAMPTIRVVTVIVIVAIILVVVFLVLRKPITRVVWIQKAIWFDMAFLVTEVTSQVLFVLFRRHRSCAELNKRKIDVCVMGVECLEL